MLVRILNGLVATAALALLGACSTPFCDTPGGLCAPGAANTSMGNHPRAADLMAGAPRARAAPAITAPPPPAATVQTMPVDSPDSPASPNPPAAAAPGAIRIGLMLPLKSEALGAPAEALRAGFMAAYERDRAGFVVNLIETGDSSDEAIDAYMAAAKQNDLIVGPLARPAVSAIAASGAVSKPTIALNYPEARGPGAAIPDKMLIVGLSIEDEARQVAQWAAAEHPRATALIVSGNNPWQRRLAAAFGTQWRQLGKQSQLVELAASNGYLSEAGINQLKLRVEGEPPALIFAALDADQLRQVRGILGSAIPVFGTSSVNPGSEPGMAQEELEGLRLLDMPWQVHPEHSAVMVYPRRTGASRSLDMDRLYALGIDAFRITREIAQKPNKAFQMDGVTGRLSVSFGQGPASFERIQPAAVYQAGSFRLVDKRR